MISSLLVVIVCATLQYTLAADVNKVNVTIYTESDCPCTGMWEHEFHDLIMTTDLVEIIDLYRYWDGKAEPDGNISCFHGEHECNANILQQCTQNMAINNNWQQWMNYTYCIYGDCFVLIDINTTRDNNTDPRDLFDCTYMEFIGMDYKFMIERERECAVKYNYDWDELYQCFKNGTGLYETWLSMKRGNDNGEVYGKQGLPVVWVNGTLFSKFWDCNSYQNQLQPLIKQICDVYDGVNPPSACLNISDSAL